MKNKMNLIVTLITVSIFLFMTIGYAAYGANLNIAGRVTYAHNGEIAITNATLFSHSNMIDPQNPLFDKDHITFDLNFEVENNSDLADSYQVVYEITLSNTTFYDYEFASAVFNPSVETLNNNNLRLAYDTEGITQGEIIPALTTKTFKLVIDMYPQEVGNYNVSGESEVGVEQENQTPTGSLIASLPSNSQVNLRNGTVRDNVTISVINSFDTAKGFTLSINNANFKIVNSSGNNLGTITVPANSTQTYDIYFQKNNNLTFATDYQTSNLFFNNGSTNTNLGSVKILVDKDNTLLDDDPPLISDVQATFVADNGKVNLTWSATDINAIDHFVVEVYDNTDTLINTYNTTDDSRNYQVTGLSNGTYYFKVYGEDSKQNKGKEKATSCDTTQGFCSASTSSTYKWVFDITYDLDNYVTKQSGPTSVVIGESLTATFRLGNNRQYNQVTTRMGGTTLTSGSGGYTWSANNNRLTINSVTGDVTITITTSSTGGICLVKGTKVLLGNGKYKNIEDVRYDDLLSVWSYDEGSLTKEYPIWIEKTSKTDSYQRNTFSDGSVLNTVGFHGIFSSTYNEFISVDDYNRFKVGTEVLKVENGKLKKVKVAKIEHISEEVNYYHVVSSRYYNIIANDFLTTDGTVILSNLYGFNKNVTWNSDIRNKVISDKKQLYSYSEFADLMPYYMFNGLRAEEGKFLTNYGLTKEIFMYYLANNQMNESMLLSVPTNNLGKRVWMVTTDKDVVINKKDFLYEEGDYYTLPQVLGVTKWYSTSEDKYYRPLEKVKVNHSMHFVAK